MRLRRDLAAAGLLGLLSGVVAKDNLVVLLDVNSTQLLNLDFPDPSGLRGDDGKWYAFATNNRGHKVQVAVADGDLRGPWSYLNLDALPDPGPWAAENDVWAPDVRRVGNTYVLYYSARLKDNSPIHCVGVATSDAIVGPYMPAAAPWACPVGQGGAIDASGFRDTATGRQWVMYKIDGNALGHGGSCNNGVEPLQPTPIMLQEVADDGVTKIGDAFPILDRTAADGPLVEAPNMAMGPDGSYVLFYSSGCYDSPSYDVKYATAGAVEGPYTRGGNLLKTGDFGLTAPGGATAVEGSRQMLLHANCHGTSGRCMFLASWAVNGDQAIDSQR